MSSLTTAQITNLNNSMSAAQDVALGSALDSLLTSASVTISGSTVSGVRKVVSGTLTPTGPSTPVASGLTSVTSVVVSLGGAPKDTHIMSSASVVSTNMWFTQWKGATSASSAPVISTGSAAGHFTPIYWIAEGAA